MKYIVLLILLIIFDITLFATDVDCKNKTENECYTFPRSQRPPWEYI